MPRLDEKAETYFTTVRGMCRTCRTIVPARVFFRDGAVWQQALCPTCTTQPAKIAGSAEWYLRQALASVPDRAPLPQAQPPRRGCPHDCGPCTWHASPCQLPVFSITNACNLDCPICFTYNRPDRKYFMPVAEMQATVDWIVAAAGSVDLINITGGEPTLHPQLTELLAVCRRPEIGRITMNSNGLKLAEDPDLCARLAELGVYVVLSFNTLDPEVSRRLHGRDLVGSKLRAIDNLTRAGVKMTLLQVMIPGVNEAAAGDILELMRQYDSILSYTVQTMTYTGQGGGQWPERRHLPVDEAAATVCSHSGGRLAIDDFLPRPSAHPLCYLTAYFLKDGDRFLPLARCVPRDRLLALMRDSYLIRLDDDAQLLRDGLNQLYARGETEALRVFRGIVEKLYPADRELSAFARQQLSDACVRTVYVHAHMDEDTFDCSRAMTCPDLVPATPGRLIPACTYNLIYRMEDERYYVPTT